MKRLLLFVHLLAASLCYAQNFQLNEREYFERQGVNVLVFSNSFNGGFNDEKNSGVEIIHHGVRTVQGGAVRLNNTPEQWDLVPKMTSRKVNREEGSIEVCMRYDDYDFDSRLVVTAKGQAVEIAVWLDKPVPEKLAGEAGFNLEFLPSQYWLKTYSVDGRLGRLPRYATSQTITRPIVKNHGNSRGLRPMMTVVQTVLSILFPLRRGNNRADFSFIPGNVAPGLLFRRPDHFENYDDWPFLWGQNEGTIAGNTQYIIFGSALKRILLP